MEDPLRQLATAVDKLDAGNERIGAPFAVCEDDSQAVYVPAHPRSSADVRRKALRALAGSWKDKRSAKEIVDDIERHRTRGRKVEL